MILLGDCKILLLGGWVVEADFFEQLKRKSKIGECVSLRPVGEQFLPAERTIKFDHTKNRNRLATLEATNTRAKIRQRVKEKVDEIEPGIRNDIVGDVEKHWLSASLPNTLCRYLMGFTIITIIW